MFKVQGLWVGLAQGHLVEEGDVGNWSPASRMAVAPASYPSVPFLGGACTLPSSSHSFLQAAL